MIAALVGTLLIGCWFVPPAPHSDQLQDEVDRLVGHTTTMSEESYEIVDVAGEGAPRVGCVKRAGAGLVLVTAKSSHPLAGPLAIPRIAGPNYKVWAMGEVASDGTLTLRRLGILAGPSRSACSAITVPTG